MIAAWELFSFALFWLKSGNNEYACHFLNIMAPNHLGLVVFHLYGAGIPPNSHLCRDAYKCQSSAGFLWSPPLLSELWISCRATIYFYCHLFRETEKYSCHFRRGAHGKSTHTIRKAQCRIIQFSCNQKEGGKKERENPRLIISAPVFEEGACC